MSSDPTDKPELFYFCDESSFMNEDFMGVGGLAIRKTRIPDVARRLRAINTARNARGEIKWESTRDINLTVRKDYIDYMVELIREGKAHLHVRFAPFTRYDHKQSGPRRIYDTVSKMYYQLLLHRAVNYYGAHCRISVRPDNGSCTSELEQFVEALHIDGQRRYKTPSNCILGITCLNSTAEPLLQFLDVSLGALTAYRNGRHLRDGTREAKKALAEHAYLAFGIRNLSENFGQSRSLSIWNVIPKKRGPRG